MTQLNSFREVFLNDDANITNIVIEQNASFNLTINLTEDDNLTPIILDGWEVTGSIRQTYDGPVVTFFTSSIVGVNTGTILETLSGDQTWELSNPLYHYDIIANDPFMNTHRLIYGKIKIVRGVTTP